MKQLENLTVIIEDILSRNVILEKEIYTYKNPYDLIKNINNSDIKMGIYFLDIELQSEINGLDIAENIRKVDPFCWIVFITANSQYMSMTLKRRIGAMDYIVKPYSNEAIEECISAYLEYYLKNINLITYDKKKYLYLESGRITKRIIVDDIMFFETVEQNEKNHKIRIHLSKQIEEFRYTLRNLEKELEEQGINQFFFRCHASYIVNMKQINQINEKISCIELIMNNNSICYVSKRNKREFKKLYQKN